jgi:type IV pilus assembly protein PilB
MAVNFSNNRLVQALLRDGLINAEFIKKLELFSDNNNACLARALLENGIKASVLLEQAVKEFKLPYIDVRAFKTEEIDNNFTSDEMRKGIVFPIFKSNGVIALAVADPSDTKIQDQLRFKTRSTIVPLLANAEQIYQMIDNSNAGSRDMDNVLVEDRQAAATVGDNDNASVVIDISPTPGEAKVVQFVNGILAEAISKGASDLHFEPYETSYRIRFRMDGVLSEVASPPNSFKEQIAARIKVMSGLDITERRMPQDGRIKVKLGPRVIDFRISILPTLWGEKIVMRILDGSAAKLNIDILGFEDIQKEHILEAIAKPQGMILVTGPTGSGKTVTLYTCIGMLNKPTTNISTAEDPVEINLFGVNQVAVNPKVGLTFAVALKAFLRQDPDIVMVGEIRDLETADIAIKAAQTGHLVLSTLHTNSAPETLTRLVNMGVETFNLASTVHLIIAQRLGRRLCSQCKEEITLDTSYLIKLGFTPQQLMNATLYGPVGCDACHKGYKGRVGIYEVMPISDAVTRLIIDNKSAVDIADQARREKIDNIRMSGIKKVLEGVTSIEELLRVTSE